MNWRLPAITSALALFLGCATPRIRLPEEASSGAGLASVRSGTFDGSEQRLLGFTAKRGAFKTGNRNGWRFDFYTAHIGSYRRSTSREVTITSPGRPDVLALCTYQERYENPKEGERYVAREAKCIGDQVHLELTQPTPLGVQGTMTMGEVSLEITGILELSQGNTDRFPVGFTFRDEGKWIASVEHFAGGGFYEALDCTPGDREAAVVAALLISAGNDIFDSAGDRGAGIP